MPSEHLVEIVAKAIFEQRVAAARTEISKIAFDCSDLPLVFSRLNNESQTAQILIFSSFLEDKIEVLFKSHLLHLNSKKIEDGVFGSNGPLGTFGNRLTLAYQLGWLSQETKVRLDAFRKIRNEFAHNAFKISFSDERIVALFSTIEYEFHDIMHRIKSNVLNETGEDPTIPVEEFTQEKLFLGQLALLAVNTFKEFLVRPTAKAYQVSADAIFGDYDEIPDNVKDIFRNQAGVLLTLFQKPEAQKETDSSGGTGKPDIPPEPTRPSK